MKQLLVFFFLKFRAFVSLVQKEFAPELINAGAQMAFTLKYLLAQMGRTAALPEEIHTCNLASADCPGIP